MCVCIFKKAGKQLPSEQILSDCWLANPDGAGFCYPENGKIRIKKGFMTFEEFLSALEKVKNIKEKPFLIHFRIATHGGISPQNCHPFPVSENENELKAIDFCCKNAFVHNGILPFRPRKESLSDSQEFSMLLARACKPFEGDSVSRLLHPLLTSNRVAFMDSAGTVNLCGQWEKYKGYHFSNLNFSWEKWTNAPENGYFSTKCNCDNDFYSDSERQAIYDLYEDEKLKNPNLSYNDFLNNYLVNYDYNY